MSRHPRLHSSRFGLLCLMAGLSCLLSSACEREPAPPFTAPAPVTETPQEGARHWTDLKFPVFKGIPARVHFAIPAGTDAAERAAALQGDAQALLEQISRTFNAFDSESEVGRFNADPSTEPLPVSEDLALALDLSRRLWTQTDGAFDITVWPLKALWNVAKERQTPPTDAERAEALTRVGMDKLTLDLPGRLVTRSVPGVALDFGGIIKGYAVDRLSDLLAARGASDAMIQIGGEIRVFGRNPEKKTWRLGIQNPVDLKALSGALSIPGPYAVSSSGNYRQPVVIGETTYYHIFDPKTGQTIPTRVLGVTVVIREGEHPNARADAWATALAGLGVDKGLELARVHGFGVAFLVDSGLDKTGPELYVSEGLRPFVVLP